MDWGAYYPPPTGTTATVVGNVSAMLDVGCGFGGKSQALADFERGWSLVEFLAPERNRVKNNRKGIYSASPPRICNWNGAADADTTYFAQALLGCLWQNIHQDVSLLGIFYDTRVTAHLPRGRDVYGTLELTEFLSMYTMGLSEIAISVDHVACIPYLWEPGTGSASTPRENGAVDLAVRWTMTAKHTGDSDLLGPASGAPVYLLAGSHWRVVRGTRIREEWTVWDEIALLRQVESYRLTHP
uniref:Uncharacterized protein n=1 Tax=Proboscia inermis TaxID=420281 RepID=A0A7S0CLJ7_9STRA|mmetsp:Transcript_6933/g.7084  ORF Transcript_6933/g.7084 Transcript_6933/m.7084 type:complete len:242 (+) Transcript_6933:534-1259(+)